MINISSVGTSAAGIYFRLDYYQGNESPYELEIFSYHLFLVFDLLIMTISHFALATQEIKKVMRWYGYERNTYIRILVHFPLLILNILLFIIGRREKSRSHKAQSTGKTWKRSNDGTLTIRDS